VCCYDKILVNVAACRSNFNVNLHYLFVHMLVYNKYLLMAVLLHIWKARHKVL